FRGVTMSFNAGYQTFLIRLMIVCTVDLDRSTVGTNRTLRKTYYAEVYVAALENEFRQAERKFEVMSSLIAGVECLLKLDECSNTGVTAFLDILDHSSMKLPYVSEVKSLGRKKKIQRHSALPKDFAKTQFRSTCFASVRKQSSSEVEEEDEQNEEQELCIVLIKAVYPNKSRKKKRLLWLLMKILFVAQTIKRAAHSLLKADSDKKKLSL
ncbi:hypothetical protein CU098_006427, partial [Rhizopus stolonifer]